MTIADVGQLVWGALLTLDGLWPVPTWPLSGERALSAQLQHWGVTAGLEA